MPIRFQVLKEMSTSRTKALVTLLLLCVAILPIIQLGVVSGARGGGGGGGGGGIGGGGGRPSPSPNPPSRPPVRPNPLATINVPSARPTISQPTARPTFSASFTRSIATSFSFASSMWTGISITRTYATSYTMSPTFTWMTTTNYGPNYPQYWYPGMGFFHYGSGYSATTGSFTLGQTLYDQNNNPCIYYDYFTFDAPAGLSITAQVWTTGPPINYLIIPVSVLSLYQSPSSCSALGNLGQVQSFGSTPYTISWTASQNDQYAIVFYSTTPYSGPVYFLPQ